MARNSIRFNSNPGPENCKPTSGEAFESVAINTAEVFEHTLNALGTFAYHCELHGCPMKGTMVVK
jgi:plastocyanin